MNHFRSNIRSILLLFPLLTLGGTIDLSAQIFKTYYHHKDFLGASHFTANKLILVPGTDEVAFAGELKKAAPDYDAYGYVMHTTTDGQPTNFHTIVNGAVTTTSGIRTTGLAMDKDHRYFLSGGSVQDLSINTVAAERTLTCLETDGKFSWGRMQGFYNFDAVIFDENDQSLVTLSGPAGNLNPPDLVLQKYAPDGSLLDGVRIETNTADQAVELLNLGSGEGYVAIGLYDSAGAKKPFIIRVDQQLSILWSQVYELDNHEWEVQDLDILPNGGPIGISGSIQSMTTGLSRPFILTVDLMTGEPVMFQSYEFAGSHEAKGYGLAAWYDIFNNTQRGWILSGAWSESMITPLNRNAFAMKVGENGKPNWAWNYSNFVAAEYDLDEYATDVVFIPVINQFVVVGEYTRYQNGNLDRRMIFQVRAGINQGYVSSEGTTCNGSLLANMQDDVVSVQSMGSPIKEGAVNSYVYGAEQLVVNYNYCSYSSLTNPKPDVLSTTEANLKQEQVSLNLSTPVMGETADAMIFDLTGRLVRKHALPPGTRRLDIKKKGLTTGLYLVRVSQGENMILSEKIWIR